MQFDSIVCESYIVKPKTHFMALQAASLVPASFFIPKEGKSSLSLKDSILFGLSLSESFKADFSSSALRCKALLHASVACNRKLIVDWVPAEDLEEETFKEDADAYNAAWSLLKGANENSCCKVCSRK